MGGDVDEARPRAVVMRLLLLIGALVAELIAAGAWFNVVVDVGDRHAHGYVALGLVLYLLAVQPLGSPPKR